MHVRGLQLIRSPVYPSPRLILIHACARIATVNMHRFLRLFLFIHTIFFWTAIGFGVYTYDFFAHMFYT